MNSRLTDRLVFPVREKVSSASSDSVAAPGCDVTVIILTANEEANIAQALESVSGWARETLILDSYSTDKTLEIARRYPCSIHQNPFVDYAKQRNHALDHLPIQAEWVLFL